MTLKFIEGKGPEDLIRVIDLEIIRREAEADALQVVKQAVEAMTEPVTNGVGRNTNGFLEVSDKYVRYTPPEPILPVSIPGLTDQKPDNLAERAAKLEGTAEPDPGLKVRDRIILALAEGPLRITDLRQKTGIKDKNLYNYMSKPSPGNAYYFCRTFARYGFWELSDDGKSRLTVLQRRLSSEAVSVEAGPVVEGTPPDRGLRDEDVCGQVAAVQETGRTDEEPE